MDYSYNLKVIRTSWLKNNKIMCLVSEPDVCIQIKFKTKYLKPYICQNNYCKYLQKTLKTQLACFKHSIGDKRNY